MENTTDSTKPPFEKASETNDDFKYEDRLQVPYMEKSLGDEDLKKEDYTKAAKHFSKAIMAIKVLNDDKTVQTQDIEKYVKEVGIPSNLNLSLIYLKLKDWKGVIDHTSKVLEIDSKNVKARYRRCVAYINKKNFDKADNDLYELEDQIGGSKELENLEEMFENKKNEEKNEEGRVFRRMFKKYVESKIYK